MSWQEEFKELAERKRRDFKDAENIKHQFRNKVRSVMHRRDFR
jgi:hypothetical protein